MTIHLETVGIDVAKPRLDIFDGHPFACANTAAAIAPLARRWAEAGALVVFEATGAYTQRLRRELTAAGAAYACVNPGRARDFARAAGFLAKTDQVDARMLAAMGRALPLRAATPPDPAREQLGRLHRRRDQLVEIRKQERTRLREVDDPEIRADIERHLAWLDGEIAGLDRRLAAAIAGEPALEADRILLCSISGVGPVTAATLLAHLPELGQRTPKTIAALAGLAPLNRDSGQHRGARTIGGGRRRVRQALYMAAVSASASQTPIGERYRAMRAAGKPAKLALIATARRLLVTANAVLRDRRPYSC